MKLTNAQVAALQCSGVLEEPLDEGEVLLAACVRGDRLVFEPEQAELLAQTVNEISNLEAEAADEYASCREHELARLSRGASVALGNLASKLWRA